MNVAVLGMLASGSEPWDGVVQLDYFSMPTLGIPDISVVSETPVIVGPEELPYFSMPTLGTPATELAAFRLLFDGNGSDEQEEISTVGATVSASSGSGVANLIDGSTSTFWTSTKYATSNQWLKVDFGEGNTVRVGEVGIYPSSSGAPHYCSIQGSNNDVDWDTLSVVELFVVTAWQYVGVSVIGNYRYIRLFISNHYGGNYLYVYELKFFTDNFDTYYYATDEICTIPECAFIRDGYIFGSWNSQADGLGDVYTPNQEIYLTEPFTLYAQWEEDEYEY